MNILLGLALIVGPFVLVEALLARFEVMIYAAGWRTPVTHLPVRIPYARGAAAVPAPDSYLVYLDGIGKRRFGDTRDGGQLVRAVLDTAPELRVLGQIQPYSPLAVPLGSRPVWMWLRRRIGIVLFLHNVVQVFVAADRRYRPLYNQAVGVQIAGQLRQAGYVPDSGVPVVLLSYSGGAQVATGAVTELRAQLRAPLILINIGGFHNGANRLDGVYSVHELTSRFDRISRVGRWVFPPRWRIAWFSGWNRALHNGDVQVHGLEPATHVGPLSYISASTRLPDGRTPLERTTQLVVSLIRADVAALRTAPDPAAA